MQRGICAYRLVEALRFTLFIEKAVLVALGDKEIKLEITTRKLHATGNRRPLAEADRLVFCGTVSQRITADDVLPKHVAEGE